jgi:autotransporter-associated beta strand protein
MRWTFKELCFWLTFLAVAVVQNANAQSFVHPGCLNTTSDFARMAAKVNAGAHPWIDCWNILTNNASAQTSYTPRPQTQIIRGGTGENYSYAMYDAAAAYQLGLRWQISGNNAYANAATNILNQWANTCTNLTGDPNYALASGLYGYAFACAAENLRSYANWKAADFAKFQSFMTNVFYPKNNVFLTTHEGSCSTHCWANWDLCNMNSMLAIGVLCDRRDIYNQAIAYYTNGIGAGAASQVLIFTHPGYLGQCQESGRDQGHCTLDPILLSVFCEIAWNQGDDMYGYNTNELLQIAEYVCKDNVQPLDSNLPFVCYMNCDYYNAATEQSGVTPLLATAGRGTIRPGWSLIYNHYVNRRGLSAPWTGLMMAETAPEGGGGNYGPNSGGYDQLGFTTLTHTLDAIAPTSVPAPSQLIAQPRNNTATLSWFGSAGATSYNVKRATSLAGNYTNIASVPISALSSSYVDIGLSQDTTYYYKVSAIINGVETTNSLPASATPNLQLAGAAIGSAGSYLGAGADKTCLFDGSLNNFYDAANSSGDWGGLDLGRGNVITQVAYCPRPGYSSLMTGGKFQGANVPDFSSGVVTLFTIGTAPADTTPPTLTYQTVSNPNAFRYVRYLGTNGASCNAAEIRFFGAPAVALAPAAPLNLQAAAGNQQAALKWSESEAATSYNVKRATVSGGAYTIVATNVLTTTFTDTGLNNSTIYFYVISAVNGAGEGSNSTEVAVAPSIGLRAGSLVWSGGTNGIWNMTASNWLANFLPAIYQDGSSILFDDTAAWTNISLAASVAPSAVTFNNNVKSYTLSGSPITGSCALSLLGTGSLQLGGTNSFTGGTMIEGGTVIVGNSNVFGSGVITLAGGTIQWGATGYTFTNAISVQAGTANSLIEAGNSSLVFSGNITGSGAIVANASVSFGGAQLSGNNSGYSGTLTVNNSSSQRFRFLAATAGSSNAVWVLNNNTGDGQSANFGAGTLYFGALSGGGQFRQDTAGTTTLEIGALNQDSTFSGILYQANTSDIFAVNKVGTGTLNFSGVNNYTGLTAVKNGRLLINQNQTGAGGFTVSSSATLAINNTVPANMADLGALTLAAGSTLEFQNISNLTSALIDTTTLAVSGASKVLITGTAYLAAGKTYPLLTNSGTMSGFGNLSLQMPLGYTGVLVSNANQISLTVSSATGGLMTNVWQGNVSTNWDTATANWLQAGGAGIYSDGSPVWFDDSAAASTVNLAGSFAPSFVTFSNSLLNYVLTSPGGSGINGTNALIKMGSGTLELAGTNNFSGGLAIRNGTVQADNTNALGTGAVTLGDGVSANSVTLLAASSSVTFGIGNPLVVASGGSGVYKIQFNGSKDFHLGGGIALNNPLTVSMTAGGAIFADGVITSGAANPVLTVDGGGTTTKFLYLTANNVATFNGNVVVVNQGDLKSGNASSLSATNTVFLDSTSTFDNGSQSLTIAGLNDYAGGGGTVADAGSGKVLTLAGSGNYSFSGIINNVGGITKTNTGTQALLGANTFTGPVNVNQGKLVVSSDHSGNNAFTVTNGATLAVTNLEDADSASIYSLTLGSSSPTTLEFQGVADAATPLILATNVSLKAACKIQITGTNNMVSGTMFPLVNYSGTFSGTFANFSLQMPAGWAGTLVSNAHQIAVSVLSPPSAPTNLLATAGDAKAVLNWSTAANATGYFLKRSTTSGSGYSVVAGNYALTGYTNTGLANGTTYYYVVTATNAAGESVSSIQASALPLSSASVPVGFVTANGQLQIIWPPDHIGWVLQAQTNSLSAGLGTNWASIQSSSSTNQIAFPIVPTNGSVFYRLAHP